MDGKKAVGEAFQELVRKEKISQSKLATTLGCAPSTISDIINGNKMPGGDIFVSLKRSFPSLNLDRFFTGEGPLFHEPPSGSALEIREDAPDLSSEYLTVPLYDVRAAAGAGAVAEREEIVDKLAFRREFIRGELGLDPKDLSLIFVEGDSMAPLLNPGDVILVHHQESVTAQDGIFVVRMDGGLIVKRLQWLPGGRISVLSENPSYDSYQVDRNNWPDDFKIVGRVVWAGKRL